MTIRRNDVPGVVDSFWDGFFQPIHRVLVQSIAKCVCCKRKDYI